MNLLLQEIRQKLEDEVLDYAVWLGFDGDAFSLKRKVVDTIIKKIP